MKAKGFTKEDMEALLDKEGGLTRYFNKIKTILHRYMDMEEEFYSLVAVWIIGTYFHKQFSSYPYLYFNAMKGSGKSRMLKLIATLSLQGKVTGSMTEAVLFRTATQRTLCIDEFEGINAKGNENLKLLLNSAYKKGLSVDRMEKKKVLGGEVEHVPVSYEVFCPIAMANIWGMDNVLSDRCISIILEKSARKEITKLIENFENEMEFKTTKGGLLRLTEKLQGEQDFFKSGLFDDVIKEWNNASQGLEFGEVYKEFFKKIDKTNLSGRDLELFFPLFIIADMISDKALTEIIKTAEEVVKIKKETDREENRDIQIYEFVAQYEDKGFIAVSDLVKEFKEFYDVEEKDSWINSTWLGRGLRRLKLVGDTRRTTRKREVRLNIEKAQKQIKQFREPDFKAELQAALDG